MYKVSNEDFFKAVRLLRVFANSKGETLREREDRRQAALLVKKLSNRPKETG